MAANISCTALASESVDPLLYPLQHSLAVLVAPLMVPNSLELFYRETSQLLSNLRDVHLVVADDREHDLLHGFPSLLDHLYDVARGALRGALQTLAPEAEGVEERHRVGADPVPGELLEGVGLSLSLP